MKAGIKSFIIVQILFLYGISLFSFEANHFEGNISSKEVKLDKENLQDKDSNNNGQNLYNFDSSINFISETFSHYKLAGNLPSTFSFVSQNLNSQAEKYALISAPVLKINQIDLIYSFHSFW